MRKLLILIMILAASLLYAAPGVYLKVSFEGGYTTNAFSDPLPINGDPDYLDDIEFIKRANIGLGFSADIFSETSVAGFSCAALIRFPVWSQSSVYQDGGYVSYDSLDGRKIGLSFSLGPIFRARLKDFDVSMALRVSIASYDLFTTGLLFGIIAEPSFTWFFSENWFMSAGLALEAHLMKFLDSSYSSVYQEGFNMITASATIGIGWKIGERE